MDFIQTFNRYFQKADNKEILTSSMVSMIYKVAGMASGYVFVMLSIRFTSIGQYGVFSLCLALIQCSAIVGRLGFDSSIVKHVSLYSTKPDAGPRVKEVYLKGLLLITVAGLGLSGLIYVAAPLLAERVFHQPALVAPFRFSIWAVLPSIYWYYNSSALRGIKKVTYFSGLANANYISAIAILLVIVYFLPMRQPLEMAYAIGAILVCGLSFFWWFKFSRFQDFKASDHLKETELLAVSLPMLSAGALYIINGWTDTVFLGMLSTEENVGIFNVLIKVAALTHTVLFAVNSFSAPQFARLHGLDDKTQLQKFVSKSTKLIVITTAPLLLVLLAAYVPFIRLFGADFRPEDYIWAFIFLCIGQAVNSFCGAGGQLLIMTGHQNTNRNIIFISFVTSIILNLLLIPTFGLHGAAFANMVGLIVRNVLYIIYTNRLLQINTLYNPVPDIKKIFRRLKKH
jgi:O-antigen/teichoic acid export membrane protein